ncbi:MAG: magnesium and cobalt transport protein CorA [Acidimicrobiaceae bacterium]|nr:magnesium and cobalt transport protein CorA [Acidimicrobiaceae bacterium]
MIVDCAHYADGRRQREDQLALEEAAEVCMREDESGFVWIALLEPDASELTRVQNLFGLHDLAVEDAQAFHLRPKVEQYDEGHVLFAVIRTAQYFDEQEDVEFGEVSIFLSRRFLITVRQGVASELATARRRVEARPELLKLGPAAGLWAILDKIVDDYSPVVAGLENDVEQIEGSVFRGTAAATERIYKLRREATDFYRAVHPLLGPLDALERALYPQVAKKIIPFFRDVNDHLKFVNEEVVGLRDTLGTVLQANIAVISLEQNDINVRQNETTKQLTVIATIFLPLTFLTGFFGMNFGWMVNHVTSLWSFLAFGFGSLAASCVVLWAWFRRSGLAK